MFWVKTGTWVHCAPPPLPPPPSTNEYFSILLQIIGVKVMMN